MMFGRFKLSLKSLPPLGLATLALLSVSAPSAWAATNSASSPWPDLLIRTVVLAVFLSLGFFLLRKPVSKFFAERRDNIAHTLDYLETQEKNLQEQIEIAAKKMDDLAAEREDLIARFEDEGRQERDKLIAEARTAADKVRQQAEAALAQEIAQAREALKTQVAAAAAKLAEELIKKGLTSNDQKRLTEDFMAQVTNLATDAEPGRLN